MKIAFLGKSHAAQHLSAAAAEKGFELSKLKDAELIFVSEDTPTDEHGNRDLPVIAKLVSYASSRTLHTPIVLTSAVPVGFCREQALLRLWHQAEILRIKDAEARARHPEMCIVGSFGGERQDLPPAYEQYLWAWGCPILRMTYEEAEFAKIAINVFLAAQVDTTNRLAAAALKVGARWDEIARALMNDRRIGPHAYLTPGRWQDSSHLLRDSVTLAEIEAR